MVVTPVVQRSGVAISC